MKTNVRVGFGYDVHRLSPDIPLWLGGIQIPHHSGLVGHSDADVLIHALIDALLGAAALGDIGRHFPDTDASYKGIDSKILLARAVQLLDEKGWGVGNVDITVCAQQPRLSGYISAMQETLAALLHVDTDSVSVKATTTERLGFTGREEGISAYAVALIERQ
jgi:2-C-methyl-D-erythritol 2,4-cyclodiphosphate synthase